MMLAGQNQGDVGLSTAESFGNLTLRHDAFQSPDFGNLLFGQEFLVRCDTSDVDSVLLVGTVVYPFEVRSNIVGFDAINVIDHGEIVRIGNERECGDSVNEDVLRFSILPQTDLMIPKFMGARSQDLSVANSRLNTSTKAVKASDAADETDFIAAFKAGYISPFFICDGIHSTGCPSGVVGLTIKDPSFVATFGGSAHYGADLRFLQ